MNTSNTVVSNFEVGEVKPSGKFNLGLFLKEKSGNLTTIGLLLAGVTFLWTIHAEISNLNSRLGNVEGKMEIILQSKNDERFNGIDTRIKAIEQLQTATSSGR